MIPRAGVAWAYHWPMTIAPASSGGVKASPVMTDRCLNFSAGPAQLPEEIIRQAQQDIWNIGGSGMGIMEHSHRAPLYDRVIREAIALCRRVGDIPDDYDVLFLTGGATSQNFMVPMNLAGANETADYLVTGYWAEHSAQHAAMYTRVHRAFDGRSSAFDHIPTRAEIRYSDRPVYVHWTSNNTIYGTQFREEPELPPGAVSVCDMCSDIFSRPFDVRKYGVIYAGAQKNIGIAGVSLVIIRKDLLERVPVDRDGTPRPIPDMLRYKVQARDESRHNTPPVFPIYLCGLMFDWILRQGGTGELARRNEDKAKILYDAIDASSGFYTRHAKPGSESLMNVVFRCPTPALDAKFCEVASQSRRMENLKGHRATGGIRASIYNAMPREGCERLAEFMREFAARNG